jgi:hypothetical protein
MSNWLCSREAVKRAADIKGSDRDRVVDFIIDQVSREIDSLTNRRFIPITATRYYPWPTRNGRATWWVPLDEDLLSVSALTKEGDDVTAIASTDYFLEPQGIGPPYHRIEIDLASTAFFSAKDTHQRQIRVTGSWGYGNDTKAAGALAEADDGSETELDVTDASLIDVGDTILIGSEQMFVSERGTLDTACNTNGALTATKSQTTVTVTDGTKVKAGEIILINSERMYVDSVSGNVLTVKRGYDDTVLAAHSDAQDVYAYRTLTVTRGENGTTAATHSNAAAITKYVPPADIVGLCIALTTAYYETGRGGWTGEIGSGEGRIESRQTALNKLRDRVRRRYQRRVIGAV